MNYDIRQCHESGGLSLACHSKVPAQTQVSTRGISGGTNERGTGFSPSISVYNVQYHGASSPYAFTHLPPTLHNVATEVI